VVADNAVPEKFTFIGCDSVTLPVTVNEPDRVISYASTPVKASIDWVTCHASTLLPDDIPIFDNVFAILCWVDI
jgi:hypothetical protein